MEQPRVCKQFFRSSLVTTDNSVSETNSEEPEIFDPTLVLQLCLIPVKSFQQRHVGLRDKGQTILSKCLDASFTGQCEYKRLPWQDLKGFYETVL